MEFIEPSALLRFYLGRVMAFLLAIAVSWAAMRLIDVSTDQVRFVLAAEHADLSSSMLPLVNKMIKIVIFLFTIAAILGNWGYNTTTVLAGVGVGGLAVALAAQKTLENLFGGIAVISDRPVLVGDICRFGDRTGTGGRDRPSLNPNPDTRSITGHGSKRSIFVHDIGKPVTAG
jgi:MscS family membrane protein